MTDAAPLLEVRGLHAEYPGREGPARAVDGVDLVVNEGETVALVGESGCGKTTLARAIMGLKTAERGRGALPRRAARLRSGAPCASTAAERR